SYPDDVEVIGSAGLAALRLGRRQQALQYFDRAIETERHDDRKSRWMSLKRATEMWLLLERASHAEAQQQWQAAERLYQQAYRQDAGNIFAMAGLARAYAEQGDTDTAWSYYQKAATTAHAGETAQRGDIA